MIDHAPDTILTLTLPDGSQRSVPAGTLPSEVVRSIGERLLQAAVAVQVEGEIQDLATPLRKSGSFRVLTEKDVDALAVHRAQQVLHDQAPRALGLEVGARGEQPPALQAGADVGGVAGGLVGEPRRVGRGRLGHLHHPVDRRAVVQVLEGDRADLGPQPGQHLQRAAEALHDAVLAAPLDQGLDDAQADAVQRAPDGGAAVATWAFSRGLPAKVVGPQLNAKTGELAIEELQIAHERLRLVVR